MIVINKNSVNTVILTLTEKATITSPTFLFKFTSDITRESVLFICPDVSDYTDRYNKFNITETVLASINLAIGTINLSPTGFWKYEIFEQASTTNLLQSATGARVENGKVKVIGTETVRNTYNPTARKYKAYGTGS